MVFNERGLSRRADPEHQPHQMPTPDNSITTEERNSELIREEGDALEQLGKALENFPKDSRSKDMVLAQIKAKAGKPVAVLLAPLMVAFVLGKERGFSDSGEVVAAVENRSNTNNEEEDVSLYQLYDEKENSTEEITEIPLSKNFDIRTADRKREYSRNYKDIKVFESAEEYLQNVQDKIEQAILDYIKENNLKVENLSDLVDSIKIYGEVGASFEGKEKNNLQLSEKERKQWESVMLDLPERMGDLGDLIEINSKAVGERVVLRGDGTSLNPEKAEKEIMQSLGIKNKKKLKKKIDQYNWGHKDKLSPLEIETFDKYLSDSRGVIANIELNFKPVAEAKKTTKKQSRKIQILLKLSPQKKVKVAEWGDSIAPEALTHLDHPVKLTKKIQKIEERVKKQTNNILIKKTGIPRGEVRTKKGSGSDSKRRGAKTVRIGRNR